MIRIAITTAAVIAYAVLGPAQAFAPGCNLEPKWLCSMNETWWQGRSEADAKAFILAHCRPEASAIVCRVGGNVTRIPKDGQP
jgi:hypothetical protein